MSYEKFKEAKEDLAFSQSLRDMLNAENMAQPSPEMDMEGQPVESAQQEVTQVDEPEVKEEEVVEDKEEVKGIVEGVVEGLKSFFSKKEEEPKEVELKIAGELGPTKEEDGK